MRSTPHTTPPRSPGLITRAVSAASANAARRPRTTIALWLLLIVGCVAAGSLVGTKNLSSAGSGTGESAAAYTRMTAAGLQAPAVESVLVRSGSARTTATAAAHLVAGLRTVHEAQRVTGPADDGGLVTAGGKIALVQVQLRGDPTNADSHVSGIERVVSRVAHASPGATIGEAGPGSVGHAITDIVNNDLGHAELISLPVTLLILVLAFGALVAAAVPLLLGLTSVAGALGALGVVSQIAPSATATSSVVVLIGLAVGIDYSLFYVRREREERRNGAGPEAALAAAAASVGRAILVGGLTVVIALAGMLFSGLAVFTSIALASIVVVLIAVTGSLTVLPAVLAKLGDRIDRGRIVPRWLTRRRDTGATTNGAWAALARTVTGHPVAALVTSVCALGALTVPVIGMRLANPGDTDLPANTPVLATEHAISHWFPGAPDTVTLVATGHDLGTAKATAGLAALGREARAVAGGHGDVTVSVARGGSTAIVDTPSPSLRLSAERRMVDALRTKIEPRAASLLGPGARVQVTGDAAFDADFTHQLATATPLVIGFVLALAFVLLLVTFGSSRLALSVIGLNLLSVGAAFGLLVAVFQHHWAQSALGFTSNGAIVSWLPLFAFVILFGLSMDYTVLVLERVREARRSGDDARTAVTKAVTATGGTVTSAALVMVAVFAIFATLRLLEFKQLGFGLAAAIALDATIVRGIALPAAVTLLGERGWRVPGSPAGPPVAAPRLQRRRPARPRPQPAVEGGIVARFVRELAYLTLGLITSVISFGVVLAGAIASIVLAPVVIGGPVFAAFARAMRALADVDRWNAQLLLGRKLTGRYRSTTRLGMREWVKSSFCDPQTWRDLGWSTLHSFIGFAFGVVALTGVAVVVGLLTVPIWYWSVPSSNVIGLWHTDTFLKALAVVPFAIPALGVTMGAVKVMAACELRLATALLGRWNPAPRLGTLAVSYDQ